MYQILLFKKSKVTKDTMGLRASRLSKEQKQQHAQIKQAALEHTRNELNLLLLQTSNDETSACHDDWIVDAKDVDDTHNLQNRNKQITQNNQSTKLQKVQQTLIHTAIEQLKREDKVLVKADLVAILISLQPELINQIHHLQTHCTVKDLNALLRTIVYDPKRIAQIYHPTNVMLQTHISPSILTSNEQQSLQYEDIILDQNMV